MKSDDIYAFVFRGLLAEERLDRLGRRSSVHNDALDRIVRALPLHLLDEGFVAAAQQMALVYTAISAFENSVRQLISDLLLEECGEEWWTKCVSEKIRKKVEKRREDEDKNKWHTQRGSDPITYTDFSDLSNIMVQNWEHFEPHIPSVEWARQIFYTLEYSRNVIMHSGYLAQEDIERIGVSIRDWVKQVGS